MFHFVCKKTAAKLTATNNEFTERKSVGVTGAIASSARSNQHVYQQIKTVKKNEEKTYLRRHIRQGKLLTVCMSGRWF